MLWPAGQSCQRVVKRVGINPLQQMATHSRTGPAFATRRCSAVLGALSQNELCAGCPNKVLFFLFLFFYHNTHMEFKLDALLMLPRTKTTDISAMRCLNYVFVEQFNI